MKFFPAPEVQEIAELLIPKYHKELIGVRIDFVFTVETPKRGGKEVWGSMRKISSLPAYLGADKGDKARGINDPFFVLSISQQIWDKLNPIQKTALVDHELCHGNVVIDEDGSSKLSTASHDVEEFRCIIERYGLWRPDVKKFVDAAPQKGGKKNTDGEGSEETVYDMGDMEEVEEEREEDREEEE